MDVRDCNRGFLFIFSKLGNPENSGVPKRKFLINFSDEKSKLFFSKKGNFEFPKSKFLIGHVCDVFLKLVSHNKLVSQDHVKLVSHVSGKLVYHNKLVSQHVLRSLMTN